MGKQAETEPSEFWKRLEESWRRQGLPTSQNGVATKLGMSQGSTRRWFTGDGFPETETLREIAELGKVTLDWLLTGRLPKHPIDADSQLGFIHDTWGSLTDDDRAHVFQSAEGRVNTRRVRDAQNPRKKSG